MRDHTHTNTHTHAEQWACPGGGDGEDKRRRGLLICLTPNQLLGSSAPPLHHSSSSSSSVLSDTGERFPLFLRHSFISSLLHTFISRSAGGLPSPNISRCTSDASSFFYFKAPPLPSPSPAPFSTSSPASSIPTYFLGCHDSNRSPSTHAI